MWYPVSTCQLQVQRLSYPTTLSQRAIPGGQAPKSCMFLIGSRSNMVQPTEVLNCMFSFWQQVASNTLEIIESMDSYGLPSSSMVDTMAPSKLECFDLPLYQFSPCWAGAQLSRMAPWTCRLRGRYCLSAKQIHLMVSGIGTWKPVHLKSSIHKHQAFFVSCLVRATNGCHRMSPHLQHPWAHLPKDPADACKQSFRSWWRWARAAGFPWPKHHDPHRWNEELLIFNQEAHPKSPW